MTCTLLNYNATTKTVTGFVNAAGVESIWINVYLDGEDEPNTPFFPNSGLVVKRLNWNPTRFGTGYQFTATMTTWPATGEGVVWVKFWTAAFVEVKAPTIA